MREVGISRALQQEILDSELLAYSRSFSEPQLRESVSRSLRYGAGCAYLMIDVKIHESDSPRFEILPVLKCAASVLWESTRSADLPSRWSKTRFLLTLPETPPSGAIALARRLQPLLEEKISTSVEYPVSLDVLVAIETCNPQGDTVDEILQRLETQLTSQVPEHIS